MSATVTKLPTKDGQPPPNEPYDFRYGYGVASVQMPNGSWVCVSHDAPVELQIAMTLAWAAAWAAEQDGDTA